jgi:hypothetical protein
MPPPPIVSIIAAIVRADAHTAATDINVNTLGAHPTNPKQDALNMAAASRVFLIVTSCGGFCSCRRTGAMSRSEKRVPCSSGSSPSSDTASLTLALSTRDTVVKTWLKI